MIFDPPLEEARLLRRYKRFLADVEMPDGTSRTVHCPNPGAMLGLNVPGSPVWISDSGNDKRKHRHTLELMQVDGQMVGINTNRANALAREAMETGLVPAIDGTGIITAEQKISPQSRIDFLVGRPGRPDLFVEVKNVHLRRKPGLHEFPDSVTARGAKHLRELSALAGQGHDAMMLFIIQRNDGDSFAIASDIDPAYSQAFAEARASGVSAMAIACDVTVSGITPSRQVEIL